MPLKFCANLSFMFTECPNLLERYNLAKSVGFKAVECANPYDFNITNIVKVKEETGIKQVLINTPFNETKKEYGYAALDGNYKNHFLQGINQSIEYAKALDCRIIHIMSGIVNNPTDDNLNNLISNLKEVIPLLEKASITGVIEAINPYSLPNYYVNNIELALKIIERLNSPNIKLLLDIFHLQHIKGDLTNQIKTLLPHTGHVQIAQVPGRNEPNTAGEINYKYILQLLENLSYNGYIGLEYRPLKTTIEGLNWLNEMKLAL